MGRKPAYELRLSDFNPMPNFKPLSNVSNYGRRCAEGSACENYEDFASDYWPFIGRAALLAVYNVLLIGAAGFGVLKGLEAFLS